MFPNYDKLYRRSNKFTETVTEIKLIGINYYRWFFKVEPMKKLKNFRKTNVYF